MKILSNQTAQAAPTPILPKTEKLRDAAVQLEASFLAEMLKSAGLQKTSDAFGGGAGEDQFGSLLVRAQADAMARAGGIGLAEMFYTALLEAENGPTELTANHRRT